MNILVTGGLGYIGSNIVALLLKEGHSISIIDNLINSDLRVLESLMKIGNNISYYNLDLRNLNINKDKFTSFDFDCCIHCAGLKNVSESLINPLKYYENNLISTINLLKLMEECGCENFIFSSSATVYGNSAISPIDETEDTGNILNPYGKSKYFIEEILRDYFYSNKSMNIVILRYFNPVGADIDSFLGESFTNASENLMPFILRTASRQIDYLCINGNDYNTKDGTCIRDYIHVKDLAEAHLSALSYVTLQNGFEIFNIGTGKGYSILEIIKEFENINKIKIPYIFGERRKGDIAISYANCNKAFEKLKWSSKLSLSDMCKDSWEWFKINNKN